MKAAWFRYIAPVVCFQFIRFAPSEASQLGGTCITCQATSALARLEEQSRAGMCCAIPARQAGLTIDLDAHNKMLQLSRPPRLRRSEKPGKGLISLRKRGIELLSVPRLPTLLEGLVLCLKRRPSYCGYSILCSCRYFAANGTCAHHLLCHWLEHRPEYSLIALVSIVPIGWGRFPGRGSKSLYEHLLQALLDPGRKLPTALV